MSSVSRPVKVRFCPSPTGAPHVGLIRTALYNWAYARHMGGSFLFRIEDTDVERDSEDSYNSLIDALDWLNLDTDEGVIAGGLNAPYRQSERGSIYADVIDKLLDGGWLYESYSNKDEIDARNIASGKRKELGYDNFDRDLTEAEKLSFKADGRKPVLRLRVPDEDISFNDLVRGKITFPVGSFSDFVLVRDTGAPLYTLVNPVDDALMGVTHVLRGEDLLSSTPRQIVLYKALIAVGITDFIPEFGHLPYIMGDDNKKMSKRDPKSNLFNLRDDGFIPEGLLNYLALLGWSISATNDIFSMDEMAVAFDVTSVNPNPARFDMKKAVAINAEHIRMLDDEDLMNRLIPVLVRDNVFINGHPTVPELELLRVLIPVLKTRLRLLSEAADYLNPIFTNNFVADISGLSDEDRENVNFAWELLDTVDEESFTADNLSLLFNQAVTEHATVTNKTLWLPVRVALVNSRISLPLFDVMEVLGRNEVLSRLSIV